MPGLSGAAKRRRDPNWRKTILQAWDRQCAFCGFDGQILGVTVGIDAAHVRWFALDGPDDPDNGLALCALHHKLFDRGVLGVDLDLPVYISATYSARTSSGRARYELHHTKLRARPGTAMPGVCAWPSSRSPFAGGHRGGGSSGHRSPPNRRTACP